MNSKFSNIIIVVIIFLTLCMQSCREDSELNMPYINNDKLDYTEANASLEGQFKAIWVGMNSNYPIWDYEEEHGINWDNVYDKYIKIFKKLDLEYNNNNPVPDSIVVSLYNEIFLPLHDGHLKMYLKNIHTEESIYPSIIPSLSRLEEENKDNMEFDYINNGFAPSLKYYIENEDIEEWDEEYDYIYGKFKDGIVYYRLPEFDLTKTFEKKDEYESNERVYLIWKKWFTCIQDLHQKGLLKGVIIDLRNNSGGNGVDFQYVLGALIEGNFINKGRKFQQIGFFRQKSGFARLDYSSIMPCCFPIYENEHADIKAPIVILANSSSISTSEITCIAAKQLKNGYIIGTKTHGAFSPSEGEDDYIPFTGDIGSSAFIYDKDNKIAPFFIRIPDAAFLTMNKKIIEGQGIEPNETVHLDWQSHQATGKDNQLERALEYIRSK